MTESEQGNSQDAGGDASGSEVNRDSKMNDQEQDQSEELSEEEEEVIEVKDSRTRSKAKKLLKGETKFGKPEPSSDIEEEKGDQEMEEEEYLPR